MRGSRLSERTDARRPRVSGIHGVEELGSLQSKRDMLMVFARPGLDKRVTRSVMLKLKNVSSKGPEARGPGVLRGGRVSKLGSAANRGVVDWRGNSLSGVLLCT